MQFALPNFLWLWLLVPLVAWLMWRSAKRRHQLMQQFVHHRLLANLTAGASPRLRLAHTVLLLVALVLLVLALARPQWGYQWEEVKVKGRDVIVALDTSRSMLAEDIKPNRLERAKLAALDLAQRARSDRIGLVAFAGVAFLQCPMTLDEDAFRQSVNSLDVNIMPEGGTAIADAIYTAKKAFTNSADSHKVLVLFTDGEDHEEGVREAAKAATEAGIKIFTIGIGTPDGEPLRLRDAQGRLTSLTDANGKPVISRLNEKLLSQIASDTGGFYLRLAGANTVDTLYEKGLAPLPKGDFSSKLIKQYYERYHWPLALVLVALLAEILLPMRAAAKTNGAAKASAATTAALLLLLAIPARADTAAEAKYHYEKGRYRAAAEQYQKLLTKKPNDPRLQYNFGAANFQMGKYEEAARAFNAATAAPEDLKLQQSAYYNAGNALYRAGETAAQPQEKKESWFASTNSYAMALRMNPEDKDAKFNLDFVTKKIKELEQQQQQQQQQNQNQQNQDQQDQKDQKKDQQKQDQKNQPQDQKNKDQQQQQKDSQKSEEQKRQEQKQQEQAQQQQQKQDQQQAQKGQQKQNGKPDEKQAQQQVAQSAMAAMMTPEQAKQFLETQKGEERALIFVPELDSKPRSQDRSFKNW